MSHYSLAVLHRDPDGASIDALLAPFDEATRNPEYLTFEEDAEGPLNERTGLNGYDHNENAKYDHFTRGGRWRGRLKLKPGADGRRVKPNADHTHPNTDHARPNADRDPDNQTFCDTAQVRDIDFTPSEETYQHALAVWDYVVEGKPWPYTDHEVPVFLYTPGYYLKTYGDRETYAKLSSEFSTYAYLTEDGEWHEPGAMGYFGISDETCESKLAYREAFQRDVVNADPDLYLTVLDCHI